jgi:hypothetical protein
MIPQRFFKKNEPLADEMIQAIAEYLPLKDVFSLAIISKKYREIIMNNNYWNRYLRKDSIPNDISTDSKEIPPSYKIFRDKPTSRAVFFYIGKNGKSQLSVDANKAIKEESRLNEYQREYVCSNIVQRSIINGEISLTEAIVKALQQSTAGLSDGQLSGIKVGLTREQVYHDWFKSYHATLDV